MSKKRVPSPRPPPPGRPKNHLGYLHGHSALSRASSRHSVILGGKAGYRRATLIPDRVLPASSGDRAIGVSWAVAARRTGPRGSRWSEGGQQSVIMRPRRLRARRSAEFPGVRKGCDLGGRRHRVRFGA
jgi:hypothetical protein